MSSSPTALLENKARVNPPPHSVEAEMGVLSSIALDPGPSIRKCAERHLSAHMLYVPAHRDLFTAVNDQWDSGVPMDGITFTQFLRDRNLLDRVGGASAVTALFTFVPGPSNIDYYIDIVFEKHVARKLLATSETVTKLVTTSNDNADTIALLAAELSAIQADHAGSNDPGRLAAILDDRRFSLDNPPAATIPRYKLLEFSICTPGNLTAFQAQAKGGKTAVVAACVAATMDQPSGDCLGISSENPDGLAVIHFDTEQSPADHHALLRSALRRAGASSAPDWLRSYRLADVPIITRQKVLTFEIQRAIKDCGGVHSIFLDGTADFIADPNDPAESFAFVDKLHQLAIQHATAIVCIIHENPSSELGKTRGHLGSQLERKAETNLRLVKDGSGVTTIFAEKARHAHIPKDVGPRFAWSETENMHVSTDARPIGRPKAYDPDDIIELMNGREFAMMDAFRLCEKEAGWKLSTFKVAWKQLKNAGALSGSLLRPGQWIATVEKVKNGQKPIPNQRSKRSTAYM